jgi:hypothetical protein
MIMQSNLRRRSNAFWQHDSVASSMNKVMCECGAIYEPIKAKHLSAERIPFKCILCNRQLPQAANNPNYRLIWRPDDDRE